MLGQVAIKKGERERREKRKKKLEAHISSYFLLKKELDKAVKIKTVLGDA